MLGALIRTLTGLITRVDGMIAQVENHEALADSAIREAEDSVARVRSELGRVESDHQALERRLGREREARELWCKRAALEPDDRRSLECLRNARFIARRIRELELCLEEHASAKRELATNLEHLERALARSEHRLNALRARETHNLAVSALTASSRLRVPLEDVVQRWETSMAAIEVPFWLEDADLQEAAFERMQDEVELREELGALRRQP